MKTEKAKFSTFLCHNIKWICGRKFKKHRVNESIDNFYHLAETGDSPNFITEHDESLKIAQKCN